jgi:sec-independent protein translocase protein TatC
MAQSDKEKEQDPQENENIEPREKKEAKESEHKPETPSDEHPNAGPERSSRDEKQAEEKKSSDSAGEKDASQETPSPDSIENQDSYGDYYEGYGEEYYMDDGLHSESYSPDSESAAKDTDAKPEKKEKTAKSGSSDGGNGGDDDDDEDEEVPEGNPEKKMPFLDHLEELRWTLIRSMLAIFVGMIICFIFNEQIIALLKAVAPEEKMTLVILGPTDAFVIAIKVSLFAGIVLALPFVAYEFWKFVVPGLLAKEKKLVPPIVFFTVFCFIAGGLFAYFIILRFALDFLLGFSDQTENMIAINKYLGFVTTLILVFGVVFELPVLSFFLTKVGILTPEFLRSKRRYGIVVIFILAAMLTPPDIMTQLMLAGPLIILYEISIWVSRLVARKKREEEEREEED